MTIPLIAFLYLYLLFVFIWFIFSLIAFYHMIRYGQIGFINFMASLAYFAVSTIILFLSFQFLSQIDWSAALTISQGGVQFFGSNNFNQ